MYVDCYPALPLIILLVISTLVGNNKSDLVLYSKSLLPDMQNKDICQGNNHGRPHCWSPNNHEKPQHIWRIFVPKYTVIQSNHNAAVGLIHY